MKRRLKLTMMLTLLLLECAIPARTANIVSCSVSDSIRQPSDKLEMSFRSLSNSNGHTRISFDIASDNTPFTIYKAEWVCCGKRYAPLEPFSLIARTEEVEGKSTDWHIAIDFPFRETFDEEDVLILDTDRGTIVCPATREGQLRETIDLLRTEYNDSVNYTKRIYAIAGIILALMLLAGAATFIAARKKLAAKRKEIETLSMLVAERTDRNRDLEEKVDQLYGNRLDTLNMLCNEYFEKSDSERVKLTLFNEVEKHILALRDTKSIAELESIVDRYLDNILSRLKEQMPELSRKDLLFITYLYAGFAPRAVCIFTDIKIKNFYNRRSRLKERILASDAPDREFFVSKM